MSPSEGLVRPKEYNVKDSNVELIGTDIDHKVKFKSAASEPAWNNGQVGNDAGLSIWRIEDFQVVPWPKEKYGMFYNGDSYIVLHSQAIGHKDNEKRLIHDIFFWLGIKTSQDEAGTAAYKTVELDEFLHGTATQHREIQQQPSEDFLALFPRIYIRSGGVASGFQHVQTEDKSQDVSTLLRIFKVASAGRADSVMVHEVEPTWQSLDEDDVFVLDKGSKIWVWQGKNCSPMEKAKSAQVVADLTQAKHKETEILSQNESRSRVIVEMLGGDGNDSPRLQCAKPISSSKTHRKAADATSRKLWRLSDSSGELSFNFVKDGPSVQKSDFDSNDVFILDDGRKVWVWEGSAASRDEKALWLKVAQAYVRSVQDQSEGNALLRPISKVVEGNESPAFARALAT